MNLSEQHGRVSGDALIPNGTLAFATFAVKAMTASKSTGGAMAEVELTIASGPYARRKIFSYMMDPDDTRNGEAIRERSQGELVRALEASGVCDPKEPATYRQITSFVQAVGLVQQATLQRGKTIAIRVGIEKGKDGYQDKNRASYLSPNPHGDTFKNYTALMAQGTGPAATPAFGGGGLAAAPAAGFVGVASGFGAPRTNGAGPLAAPGWIGAGAGNPAQTQAVAQQQAAPPVDDEIPF